MGLVEKYKSLSGVQLCNPIDCSPPGSSVHRILQIRILEWVAMPFSGVPPNLGIKPGSPAMQADSLPSEPPGKPRREKLIKCIKNFKTWFEQKWIQIRQHLIQQTARSSKELHKRRPYFYFVMSSLFKIVILCDYFSLRWVFIAMHKVFSSGSHQGLL